MLVKIPELIAKFDAQFSDYMVLSGCFALLLIKIFEY